MTYEQLLIETDHEGLLTKEKPLIANNGRIKGNRIAIREDMTQIEKGCILAEELGHYYTTVGDILDQNTVQSRKQELRARTWAYNRLIGLNGIISAYKNGCRNANEIAEHLDITEEFLIDAITCYRNKYGTYTVVDNYVIYFEPSLGVFELI